MQLGIFFQMSEKADINVKIFAKLSTKILKSCFFLQQTKNNLCCQFLINQNKTNINYLFNSFLTLISIFKSRNVRLAVKLTLVYVRLPCNII